MDIISKIVLSDGIILIIIGIILIILKQYHGIFIIMSGIFLILIVDYELERDKEQEEFLKEIYGEYELED